MEDSLGHGHEPRLWSLVDGARPTIGKIGDLAAESNLSRVHILAWRDLDDVEAGGSELHAAEIAKLWAEAGVDVTMRTSHAQGHPSEVRRDGYRVIRRAGRYLVFPRAVAAEITGRHGPRDGLVEIWNGVPFFSPLWARGPHIAWLHHAHTEMWPRVMPPRLAAAGQVLERDIAPRVYRRTPIVTLSESSRQDLIARFGLVPDKVHVVAPGISTDFRPNGTPSESPLLLAVGRLMPSKEFDRLIRVACRVREQADIRLVIVGEGYERENLEQVVSAHAAEEWCELAGWVDEAELTILYQQASAVLSASSSEGWGMTLTEAAACGTPAVATRIAGHLDAVVDGETGHLVDTDDDFVAAVLRVITDQQHRNEIGEAARVRSARFTWERTAYDTLAILASEATRRQRLASEATRRQQ